MLPQGIVPPPAPAERQHLGLSWMTGPAVAFPPPIWWSCLAPHPCPAPLGGRGQQSGCAEVTLSSGLTQGSHRADQPAQGHQTTTSTAAGLVGPHQAPCSGDSLERAEFLNPGGCSSGVLGPPRSLVSSVPASPPCCWVGPRPLLVGHVPTLFHSFLFSPVLLRCS